MEQLELTADGHISKFRVRIVTRLRLFCLAICLFIIASALFGGVQLRHLLAEVEILSEQAVPLMVRAEENERALKSLLLLRERVDVATSLPELDELTFQLDTLHAEMLALNAQFGRSVATLPIANAFTKSLGGSRLISNDIAANRISQRRVEQELANKTQRQAELTDAAELILEELFFETIAQLDSLGASSAEQDDRIILSNQSSSINTLSARLRSLMDLSANLQSAATSTLLEELVTNAAFKQRGVATLVTRLPASPARVALARVAQDLRAGLLGEGGLIDLSQERLAILNTIQTLKQAQAAPIEDISAQSVLLKRMALGDIVVARAEIASLSTTMRLFLLAVAAVTIIASGLAIFLIVERQINTRMSLLTKAVRAIAEGDTEHDVRVGGQDELAEMADALEIFKKNAAELTRSNEDLETFAYVAAHDLRSPLRAIRDLSDWTLEDPDTVFSQDSRRNLELIQNRTTRLNRLLVDLLAYAMVGRDEDETTQLSMKELVKDTLAMLDPKGHFQLSFMGPDDHVTIHPAPMRQIILNLAANAIKHHDQKAGVLTVGCDVRDGRIHISFADDGPGIEPRYHQKIFELFQTLRPRDEVEGSGLGLAMIVKLVNRNGGHIAVQSDPDRTRGTCFTFDLPELSQNAVPEKLAA